MPSPVLPQKRRRDSSWRRFLRGSTAPWLAVLATGVVLIVVASLSLVETGGADSGEAQSATGSFVTGSFVTGPSGTGKPATTPATAAGATTAGSPWSAGDQTTAVPPPPPVAESAEPTAAPGVVPVAIALGDSGAPIPVVPIGVSPRGVLGPPDDPAIAGWWVSGPRPGSPGRAVITGHIDSPAGLGAFAALDDLHEGDQILLTAADTTTRRYVVTDRQEIEKTKLDPAVLDRADVTDLLLVTCIGVFDHSTLSYESNLLITAVLAPS